MKRDKLIQLGRKLKALAQQGEGGEKENAQTMLEQFLVKHGLRMEDVADEVINTYRLRCRAADVVFASQVASSVRRACAFVRYKKMGIFIKCTQTEMLEIHDKFKHYLPLLNKEREVLYDAFIQTHHLYQKPTGDEKAQRWEDLTKEEQEEYMRLREMMEIIKAGNYHKKIKSTTV